jgi:hypothetical protein
MNLLKLHKKLVDKAYNPKTSADMRNAIGRSVQYTVDNVTTTMQERMDTVAEAIKNSQSRK